VGIELAKRGRELTGISGMDDGGWRMEKKAIKRHRLSLKYFDDDAATAAW